MAGGVNLIQYRNKTGSPREMLAQARELQRVVRAAEAKRASLATPAGTDVRAGHSFAACV